MLKPRLPETSQLADLEALYEKYARCIRTEEFLEAADYTEQMIAVCPRGSYRRWLGEKLRYCQYKAIGVSDRTAHGIGYWYGGEKIGLTQAQQLLKKKLPRYQAKAAAANRRKDKYAKKALLEKTETNA